MEAIGRLFSPGKALEAARDRRDRTYDPALADVFVEHGGSWFEQLRAIEPWDAVLALEPAPHRLLDGDSLDDALTVAADFIDLKSPFWDKPAALTRAEFDRVELHPMLTEQMLRRSPALGALNVAAAAHHEKCDGSGYHKRLRADTADLAACVLQAVEIYVGLTRERADRPGLAAPDAAGELRRLESEGVLEPRACRAVLVAAGHGEGEAPVAARARNPGGLSRREVDILRLAARGLTTKQIADRLFISTKTADHHIQHVYNKIGVSTRAAAALWAMQHAVVQ